MELVTIAFLTVAGFIASAVDAIAGGGGLISLPAIVAAGVPPHMALGTNKFANAFSSSTSSLRFALSGKVAWRLVRWQIPCTALGAALGVRTALSLDERVLNALIIVMVLAVALYSALKKDFGERDAFKGLSAGRVGFGMAFAFALGFYDGFFGPGTGSFLIFTFIRAYGFDFTVAAGNAKVLNFTSNVVSLALFALGGKIMYLAGVPMAAAMVAGAWVGARVAIKNGARVIRPVFVLIGLALVAKLAIESFAA